MDAKIYIIILMIHITHTSNGQASPSSLLETGTLAYRDVCLKR